MMPKTLKYNTAYLMSFRVSLTFYGNNYEGLTYTFPCGLSIIVEL